MESISSRTVLPFVDPGLCFSERRRRSFISHSVFDHLQLSACVTIFGRSVLRSLLRARMDQEMRTGLNREGFDVGLTMLGKRLAQECEREQALQHVWENTSRPRRREELYIKTS